MLGVVDSVFPYALRENGAWSSVKMKRMLGRLRWVAEEFGDSLWALPERIDGTRIKKDNAHDAHGENGLKFILFIAVRFR